MTEQWHTTRNYDAWIRNYLKPRHPELVPCMMQALEAVTQALSSRTLTSIQLKRVVDCARVPKSLLSENAAALLGELGNHFPAAQEAVREMIADPKAHVRLSALIALSEIRPAPLHRDVLRTALRDRSSKLRGLAADKIMQFGFKDLLSDLDAAIACERSSVHRDFMEQSRDLLRDGYCLRPEENGQIWVSYRFHNGVVKSAFVSARDIESKGLAAVIRELSQ